MKIFILVRDDMTIANGVVFAPGAIIVHSLLRRDRDSTTRYPSLADVRQAFRGCELRMVETAHDATYGYVVRKAQSQRATVRKKAAKKKAAKRRTRARP